MNDSKNFHSRKNIRLKDYDYSQNGCYLITVCTENKKFLFGEYNVGAIHESPLRKDENRFIILNQRGKIAENIIKSAPSVYEQITIDNYIVMPNHFHLLITINNSLTDRAIRESPLQRSLISKVIGYVKMNISKEIHKEEPEIKIWQRSFYDRVIRNQKEYENAWQYVEYNALKEYPVKTNTEKDN